MPTLILCYAPSDEPIARRLGDFLETNLPLQISYGECVVRPDFDILAAAERALSAETSLILLSPDSIPKTWVLEKWRPVFFEMPDEFETRAGFVLLRDCRFPDLIRRSRPFFDLSAAFLPGARQIKRWLMRPDAPFAQEAPVPAVLHALRERIGDRPGTAAGIGPESAIEFAAACERDFDAAHRIDCRNRTPTGLIGHLGHTLGLRLAGTLEENRAALTRFFVTRRILAIFENLNPDDRDLVAFGGRLSTIFPDPPATPPASASLEEIHAAFRSSPRGEARCAAILGEAVRCATELLDTEFDAGLSLAWPIVNALRAAERFAEAAEVLGFMERAARHRGDFDALRKIEWEQSWLRDYNGEGGAVRILPTAPAEIAQLSFSFGEAQQ